MWLAFQLIFAHEDSFQSYICLHVYAMCYFRGCDLLLDSFGPVRARVHDDATFEVAQICPVTFEFTSL